MNIIDNVELRRRLGEYCRPLMPGEVVVLHVWVPTDAERAAPGVPTCFRRARQWGHLFGENAVYLQGVAERCGVKHPYIHRRGEPCQHVDLCGKALRCLCMAHLVTAHNDKDMPTGVDQDSDAEGKA